MRERILQWTCVPIGVGIALTQTLAKLANHVVKSADRKPGSYPSELARVCNLAALSASDLEAVLQATAVGEVWGVGRHTSDQLIEGGVATVLDLVRLDPAAVRRRWSVVLERTVRELQGQQCITLEGWPAPKKEDCFHPQLWRRGDRSGRPGGCRHALCQRRGRELRAQGSKAGQIQVFAHTSAFRPGPKYSSSLVIPLRRPTDDTVALVNAAVNGIQALYRPGFNFAKAGVMLLALQDGGAEQGELDPAPEPAARCHRMGTLNKLNDRFAAVPLCWPAPAARG